MGLFEPTYKAFFVGSAVTNQAASDGTYVWFTTRESSGARKLWRLRHSDKNLIKPDGTIGDETNAYVALNATYAGESPIATNGTYVLVANANNQGIVAYRCTDMGLQATILSGTQVVSGGGRQACYYNGYFYFPGWDNSTGRMGIVRIDATTLVGSLWYSGTAASTSGACVVQAGGYLFLSAAQNNIAIDKVDPSNATRVATGPGGNTSATVLGGSYDAVNGTVWWALAGGTTQGETIIMRVSDAAWLDETGASATFANARFIVGNADSFVTFTTSTLVVNGFAYTGSYNDKSLQRRLTDFSKNCRAAGAWNNQLLYNASPWTAIGSTIYSSLSPVGNLAWGAGGLMWMDESAAVPALTNASAFATGIHLNFDNPVNAGTPTTGGIANQMQVTGASQNGATGVDLAVTAVPTPPQITVAKASGTGVLLGFDKQVDVAASPDYGGAHNNLTIQGASKPSANQVQLAASVTQLLSNWVPVPVNVTGVGVLPHIVTAYADGATAFVLIFNEEVVESSATNPANYAILPGLSIQSITKIAPKTYRMVTDPQSANTTYQVTITGVIDAANNAI